MKSLNKKENQPDDEMTVDEMVAESRAEYAAGELKGYKSTEELMRDLNS